MKEVGPASVICRYSNVGCHYQSSGSEDFVHGNYRQHLRESHRIAHPRVEPEEMKIASIQESVNVALEDGYAAARRSYVLGTPSEKGDEYSIKRSDTGNVARARLFRDGMEFGPERAQSLMRGPHAAFDYGYAGEGPRTLALAMLIEALANAEAALSVHAAFAEAFLNTPSAAQAEIVFTRRQILGWFAGYTSGRAR